MSVSVNTIPSINIPFVDEQGRLSPIWHNFLRQFVAASADGTISGDNSTTEVIAGVGLTGGGTGSSVTLNVGAGNGIAVNANDVNVDITSLTNVQAVNNHEVMISDPSNNNTIKKTTLGDVVSLIDVAGLDATVGTDSVIGGSGAGANLTGSNIGNTFIGNNAGNQTTSSSYNVAFGWHALDALTTAGSSYGNAAIGAEALGAQTSGIANTALGFNAGLGITTSNHNVVIGNVALEGTNAANTVAIGSIALNGNLTTVSDQVVVGYQAGSRGDKNVHIGYQAGAGSNTTQRDDQVGVGYQAIMGRTGTGNVGIGLQAGKYAGTGANNTFIGYLSGATSTTGDNNTVIGYNADKSAATVSDEFTLGNSSIATLRCQQTSITALSDKRDKKDITDLSLGLDFINALRPVRFTWNMRDGSVVDRPEAGFIAQELKAASEENDAEWVGLVLETNPERLEASPGKLIPIIVKAIQELSKKIT